MQMFARTRISIIALDSRAVRVAVHRVSPLILADSSISESLCLYEKCIATLAAAAAESRWVPRINPAQIYNISFEEALSRASFDVRKYLLVESEFYRLAR
jgi:hypothetical protein